MKPWQTLAEATAPDGGKLVLAQRDREFVISVGGQLLMSSRSHGSEEAMAAAGLPEAASKGRDRRRVLVGGLGCGYTVRAVLDRLGPGGQVLVAEISAAVVEWNRGPLGPLAGHPLRDRRAKVITADVRTQLGAAAYDCILLDVDNGPEALTTESNRALYSVKGLGRLCAALAPQGRLVVWSASPDPAFAARLRTTGGAVEVQKVPARTAGRGGFHTLFLLQPHTRPAVPQKADRSAAPSSARRDRRARR